MNPVKLLIQEHKTINKMLEIISFLQSNPEKIKLQFIEIIIDFFSLYVDACHHGKEEKILFQKLKSKNLSKEDASLMNELIQEHKLGRKLILDLKENKHAQDVNIIKEIFQKMTILYISHLEKENSRFFYPAFKYFSEDEKSQILQDFYDLDKNIIHEKYSKIVEELKSSIKPIT
jgi:hemerythrin-like domain-containing protein